MHNPAPVPFDAVPRVVIRSRTAAVAVRLKQREVASLHSDTSSAGGPGLQSESPRPFLHLIRTLGGVEVTGFRPDDHPWHVGLSLALPHVGPHNFWGGPTYERGIGYVQLQNNGSQLPVGAPRAEQSDTALTLRSQLSWNADPAAPAGAGGAVLDETRAWTFAVAPAESGETDAWTLVFETVLTNVSGEPLHLGSPATAGRTGEGAGYGGLFWRLPEPFVGGRLFGDGGLWRGFTDRAGSATVLLLSPEPTKWFERVDDYAGFGPAPFASAEQALEPGATLSLRYAAVVADRGAGDVRTARLLALGEAALESAPGTGDG